MRRYSGLIVGAILALSATCASAQAADIEDPALIKEVKTAVATTPAGATERFPDGLYDAASGDVYVDGNMDAVWRLENDHLVPAPGGNPVSTREPCGRGTYFHCEHLKVTPGCQPTTFYLNYYVNGQDVFRDPYGSLLNPPEQVSIRNDQGQGYRRYGPRGVRAAHGGKYGFYSINCLQ